MSIKNPMLNVVIVQGRLTRDPELQYTAAGSPVCKFSLANEYRAKAADGSYESKPNYFDVVAWGKTAESVGTWFKGVDVQVQGKLRWEQYTNKDGGRVTKITIHADRVDRFTWPEDGTTGHASTEAQPPRRETAARREPSGHVPVAESDDDIPF